MLGVWQPLAVTNAHMITSKPSACSARLLVSLVAGRSCVSTWCVDLFASNTHLGSSAAPGNLNQIRRCAFVGSSASLSESVSTAATVRLIASECMQTFTCTHMHTYVRTHTHASTHSNMHCPYAHLHAHIHTRKPRHACSRDTCGTHLASRSSLMCLCVCMFMCVYVCVCICVCVCLDVCMKQGSLRSVFSHHIRARGSERERKIIQCFLLLSLSVHRNI